MKTLRMVIVLGLAVAAHSAVGGVLSIASAETAPLSSDQPPSSPALVVDLILDRHCQSTSADARAFRSIATDVFLCLNLGDQFRIHLPGRIGEPSTTPVDIKRRADDGPALVTSTWSQHVSGRLGVQSSDVLGTAANVARSASQSDGRHLVVVLLSRQPSETESRQARDLALEVRDSQALLVFVAADRAVDELGAAAALGARIDPSSAPRPAAWVAMSRPPSPVPSTQQEDPRIAHLQLVTEAQAAEMVAQHARHRELEQQLDRMRAEGTASVGEVQKLGEELHQAHDAAAHAQAQADQARRELEVLWRQLHDLGDNNPTRSDAGPTFVGPVLFNLDVARPSDRNPDSTSNSGSAPAVSAGNAAIDQSILTPESAREDGSKIAPAQSSATSAPLELGDVLAQATGSGDSAVDRTALAEEASAAVDSVGGSDAARIAWPIFGGVVAILAAAAVAAMYLNRKPAARTFTLLDESSKASHRIQMTSNERVDLNGAQPVKKARAGNGRVPFLTIDRKGRLALHAANGFFTKLNDRLISAAETAMVKPGSVLEITANGQVSRLVVGPVSVVNQNPKPPLNLPTPSMHPA